MLQSLPALPLCLQLLKPSGRFFQSCNTPAPSETFQRAKSSQLCLGVNGITFLEGLVDVDLTRDEVLVVLHVGEDAALVDPVVVVGAEEEDGEVADVVAKALDVRRDQARVADLCRPPPARERDRVQGGEKNNPTCVILYSP